MSPAKRYRDPESARRVSQRQIATETGMSRAKTKRYLAGNSWWTKKYRNDDGSYDPRLIELINALHGRPHRPLTILETNWLDDYLRGGPPHA